MVKNFIERKSAHNEKKQKNCLYSDDCFADAINFSRSCDGFGQ